MTSHLRLPALLAAGVILLAGCASTHVDSAQTRPPATSHQAMTPGMIMPDGSTMGASAARTGVPEVADARSAHKPSSAALMICGAETRDSITQVLKLTTAPASHATWKNHLYTCTYHLPMGTFVVSVKQSADRAAAKSYFAALRPTLGKTETLDGLGQASYGVTAGKVVLIKDNDTLMVDSTKLPAIVGSQGAKRFDFAYQIATDILGCWTGDDGH